MRQKGRKKECKEKIKAEKFETERQKGPKKRADNSVHTYLHAASITFYLRMCK